MTRNHTFTLLASIYRTVTLILILFLGQAFAGSAYGSVTWGTVNAYEWQDTLVVEWQTLTETNNQQFWFEVPAWGLFQPLGGFPSSVTNSTTPTQYQIRIPLGASYSGTVCGYIWPDDGTGYDAGNSSPQVCGFITNANTLVWPGDANSDGAANVTDLLYIGIGNGSVGTARASTSTTWTGFSATDWTPSFSNGINYKFADCNGDGTIQLADTVAINQNYGQTHNKAQTTSSGGVPLMLFYPDSVNGGDTVEVEIWLGDAGSPVSGAYGLSFTLQYDSSQVEMGKISSVLDNSWFGMPGTDLVKMQHDNSTGQFDIAVTRTNGISASGYGRIGSIGIVMVDNLGKTRFDAALVAKGINPVLLDSVANRIEVSLGVANVREKPATIPPGLRIFPNPASGQFRISLADVQKVQEVELISSEGRATRIDWEQSGTEIGAWCPACPAGCYVVLVRTDKGLLAQRIILR